MPDDQFYCHTCRQPHEPHRLDIEDPLNDAARLAQFFYDIAVEACEGPDRLDLHREGLLGIAKALHDKTAAALRIFNHTSGVPLTEPQPAPWKQKAAAE